MVVLLAAWPIYDARMLKHWTGQRLGRLCQRARSPVGPRSCRKWKLAHTRKYCCSDQRESLVPKIGQANYPSFPDGYLPGFDPLSLIQKGAM